MPKAICAELAGKNGDFDCRPGAYTVKISRAHEHKGIFTEIPCGGLIGTFNNMAHTKAKSTTKLGRDSESKRLGVKLYEGQVAFPGNIIVRQRGTKFLPGEGVRIGKDDTIYAVRSGKIKFTTRKKLNYDGNRRLVKVVNVI